MARPSRGMPSMLVKTTGIRGWRCCPRPLPSSRSSSTPLIWLCARRCHRRCCVRSMDSRSGTGRPRSKSISSTEVKSPISWRTWEWTGRRSKKVRLSVKSGCLDQRSSVCANSVSSAADGVTPQDCHVCLRPVHAVRSSRAWWGVRGGWGRGWSAASGRRGGGGGWGGCGRAGGGGGGGGARGEPLLPVVPGALPGVLLAAGLLRQHVVAERDGQGLQILAAVGEGQILHHALEALDVEHEQVQVHVQPVALAVELARDEFEQGPAVGGRHAVGHRLARV